MTVKGKFVFREFKHRDAGSWRKNGETINYDEAYILRLDYMTAEGELFEGELKVGVTETELINKLSKFKTYDDIVLEFDVILLWKDNIKLKIREVIFENKKVDGSKQKKLF